MIRPAELLDFPFITQIRKASALNVPGLINTHYKVQIQRSGFLLPIELSVENFQEKLANYSVFDDGKKIIGYIRTDDVQEMSKETKVFWFKKDLKKIYYSMPHAYIYGIGVLPQARHIGIATQLLKIALEKASQWQAPYIFSHVVLSPVTNFPSMMFHEKHGFERIAILDPITAYGMEGYQSLLYGKKL